MYVSNFNKKTVYMLDQLKNSPSNVTISGFLSLFHGILEYLTKHSLDMERCVCV